MADATDAPEDSANTRGNHGVLTMSDGNGHSREIAESNGALRALASNVKFGATGLAPATLAELMDFAQLMAKAGPMVGKAFRQNPGACVAITMQAMRWHMDPFAVSQKAYVTTDKYGNEHIGYEAQLINAVIMSSAPMAQRPQYSFTGEGARRRCKVSILLRGEPTALEYETPETVPSGNSPLWKSDLDQQLSYFAIRSWSRRHMPELIMGVYTPEELAETVEVTGNEPIDERPLITGAEKDRLVEDYIARLRATTLPEDIEYIMNEAREHRFSENTWDGLEHVAAQETERVCAGEAPRTPEPSPFEALKAEGLAALTEPDRKLALARWQAKARSKTKLALCSASERSELKTLEKTLKAEIESGAAPPQSTPDEGALVTGATHPGGAGAPSTITETEQA